jgi:hypothetical protein
MDRLACAEAGVTQWVVAAAQRGGGTTPKMAASNAAGLDVARAVVAV